MGVSGVVYLVVLWLGLLVVWKSQISMYLYFAV